MEIERRRGTREFKGEGSGIRYRKLRAVSGKRTNRTVFCGIPDYVYVHGTSRKSIYKRAESFRLDGIEEYMDDDNNVMVCISKLEQSYQMMEVNISRRSEGWDTDWRNRRRKREWHEQIRRRQ